MANQVTQLTLFCWRITEKTVGIEDTIHGDSQTIFGWF